MMRQAIITKYLGPTNSLASRIKAKAAAGSVTVSWNYGRSIEHNHQEACAALVTKLGWGPIEDWHGGGLPDGAGYVFVLVEREGRR